jgi:hypothetical protein
MYNIRRFVGSKKELTELRKALEQNDIKEIQKYIDLTRQRMIKYNMVKNLETFERILSKPRKADSKPTSRPRQKKVDLWKKFLCRKNREKST